MILAELQVGTKVLIAILCIVGGVYLLTFIINLVFVFSFKSMMKRDNNAMRVALSAKLDILIKCQEVFNKNEIKITEKTAHSLRYLDTEDFYDAQKEDFTNSTKEMELAEKEVSGILNSNRKLADNDEVALLKSLLKDVNESLKMLYMSYNADILGYNYWVRFPPCILWFLIFKVKLKKNI